MTNITETVDIDDYLYDDDEYIDVINRSYYMRYVNIVTSLTIVLIILNCIVSFVILTNATLQKDKYAYILALLSFGPPLWLIIVVFMLFFFFEFSDFSILIGLLIIVLL